MVPDDIYPIIKAIYPCHVVDTLCGQLDSEEFKQADCVFIDEAQFFTDLVDFVELAVETHKKDVFVIGLDGDSDRKKISVKSIDYYHYVTI